MNISLNDYQHFAESLNLSSQKTLNGAYKYIDKDTGDVISPYLLGKLYRLVKKEAIVELTKMTDSFEYDIVKEKHKLKELPPLIKEELQSQRYYIESLKKEIE